LRTPRMNSSPIFRTRAGGRKPPVRYIRRCESETHTAGNMSRMQPGAGGVSPPWSPGRMRARNAESHRMAVADAVRKNHRGLTPAALVNVRLCVAKGVISPVTGHRAWHQERGRQPPVAQIRRCESETHIAGDMSRMQPGAGGVSSPWETSAAANRKRIPQQVCRACNQERGGVSPPWHASVLVRAKTCATASAFRSHGGLTGGVLVEKNCAPLARRFRSHGGLTPRYACAQRAFTDDSRTPCTIVIVVPPS
jgi:hypothetical protein